MGGISIYPGGKRFYAGVHIVARGYERPEKQSKGCGYCINAAGMPLARMPADDALSLRHGLERLDAAFKGSHGR